MDNPPHNADSSPASAGRPNASLKAVINEYDRGTTANNIQQSFTTETADGIPVEGTLFYTLPGGERPAEIGLDTNRDGLIDTRLSSYNGYATPALSQEDAAPGERGQLKDTITSAPDGQLVDVLAQNGVPGRQRLSDLVQNTLADSRITQGEVEALNDFVSEATRHTNYTMAPQSAVFARGDAVTNERTGELTEGRAIIRADLDGNGTQETVLTARLSEGQYQLTVSNGGQQQAITNNTLASDAIRNVASFATDNVYTDPERDRLAALARSAVQIAGLDRIAGSVQMAAADRSSIGNLAPSSGGTEQSSELLR